MRRLAKTTAVIGSFTLINMVVALVRAKYGALILGPKGVGLLAQATMFLALATTVATLSMGSGIIKYVAQHRSAGEEGRLGDVIHSAFTLQIGLAVIMVAGVLVAVVPISEFLFSSGSYTLWLVVLAFAVPLSVFSSGFSENIFFGFNEYGTYTHVSILTVVGGLVPFVILIAVLGLKGAFISMVVVACWGTGLNLWWLYRRIPYRPLFRPRFILQEVKGLLSYGAAGFAGGTVGILALLYVRSIVVRDLGPEANGYYQVVFAIQNIYLVFLTNGLWAHFYPTMCKMVHSAERSEEINRAVRFSLLCLVPAVAALMAFREPIVYLLYSSDFMPATRLFPLQLLGGGFFILLYILNTSLLALGALRAYVGFAISHSLFLVAAFWIFKPRFGLLGLVGAYTASMLVVLAINYIYHVKVIGLRFSAKNRWGLIWSLVALAAMTLFPGGSLITVIGPLALLGVWAVVVVERKEVAEVVTVLRGLVTSSPAVMEVPSDGS